MSGSVERKDSMHRSAVKKMGSSEMPGGLWSGEVDMGMQTEYYGI